MKICPLCNTGNKNNAISCKDCGNSLIKTEVLEHDYIQDIEDREKKRHRIIIFLHCMLLPVLLIVYIFLYIKALPKMGFVELTLISISIPIISYISIHHPQTMFILKHLFTIDNIEDVELSDLYIFLTKIGGYLLLFVGFILLALCALS